jgi:putative zinc finger protein
MNCETCQELIHDLIDGSITQRDESTLNTHLKECLDCESVRQDLASIVGFCRTQRGQYEAPPNEQAMWLRIRNVIEAELPSRVVANSEPQQSFFGRLMGRSWQLSLPQLAASAAAIVLLVSLVTVVGLRRWGGYGVVAIAPAQFGVSDVNDRIWQRRQVIDYWNQRVELNKVRWSPEMRETFDRNMQVIDQAVANSLDDLKRNPHDEVSEQMLNESLNDKLALLKEFSDL